MVLYTQGVLNYLGGISYPQMLTFLMGGLGSTNEAMANSGIDLKLTMAYAGEVWRHVRQPLWVATYHWQGRPTKATLELWCGPEANVKSPGLAGVYWAQEATLIGMFRPGLTTTPLPSCSLSYTTLHYYLYVMR